MLIRAEPEAAHASQLTREEVTASVHSLHFDLTAAQIAAVAAGPVELVIDHDEYSHAAPLGAETVTELLADLRGERLLRAAGAGTAGSSSWTAGFSPLSSRSVLSKLLAVVPILLYSRRYDDYEE